MADRALSPPSPPRAAETTADAGATAAAGATGDAGATAATGDRVVRPLRSARHAARSPVGRSPLLANALRVSGLALVGLSSMAIGLLAFAVASAITHESAAGSAVRFDTTWYYRISQLGYLHRLPSSATDYGGLRVAFFPGLPIVERSVHRVVGGGPAHTTLVVGAVGLVVSCIVLWTLVADDWDERTAWRAVALFAFFPGAYVFPMAYSEALAIPLALLCMLALRRGWLITAGVAAGVAGSVRLLSVMLLAACIVGAVRALGASRRGTGDVLRALACPVLALTGLVAYAAYLKSITGHFLAFSTAERLGWQNSVSWSAPFHSLRLFFDLGVHGPPAVIINGIGVAAMLAALVLVVTVSMPMEYKVFAAGILLAWLFTTNSGAWFRFLEFAFPVVIAIAAKLPEKVFAPAVAVSAAVLAILVVLFASAVTFSP